MCGLAGLCSSYLSTQEIELLRPLAYFNSFRGEHSTGLGVVIKGRKKGFDVDLHKEVVGPAEYVHGHAFNKFLENHDNKSVAAMLHNRHATRGSISYENAHPFHYKHIMGMHNGTVNSLLEKDDKGTDSEKIIQLLATVGLDETLKRIKDGAFALVWADTKAEKLYFIRNSQRPLHFIEGQGTTIWASEKWSLEILKSKCSGINSQITELPTWTLFEIPFGSHRISKTSVPYPIDIRKPEITKPMGTSVRLPMLPEEAPFDSNTIVTSVGLNSYPYHMTRVTPAMSTAERVQQIKSRRFLGPFSKPIDFKTWLTYTKPGCCNCEKTILSMDTVWWVKEEAKEKLASDLTMPIQQTITATNDLPLFFCEDCKHQGFYQYWQVKPSDLLKGEEIHVN